MNIFKTIKQLFFLIILSLSVQIFAANMGHDGTSFMTSLRWHKLDLGKKYSGIRFDTKMPFQRMKERERASGNDSFFFYSAAENSIVLMDEIYAMILHGLTHKKLTPLRDILGDYSRPLNVEEFWQKFRDQEHMYAFDHEQQIRTHVISASHDLFSTGPHNAVEAEDVLSYFNANMSVIYGQSKLRLFETILPQMLISLGLPQSRADRYVRALRGLYGSTSWKKGGMMHIAIDSNYVDQLVYLARPYGRSVELPHNITTRTFLDLFRKGRSRSEDEDEGYRQIVNWLCKRYPETFFQVRILVTSPYFADPNIVHVSFEYDPDDAQIIQEFLETVIKPLIANDIAYLGRHYNLREILLGALQSSEPL